MIASPHGVVVVRPDDLAGTVASSVGRGRRFAGLFAFAGAAGATTLRAVLAGGRSLDIVEAVLPRGADTYPALSPSVPAAAWYEREIHDLFGLVAAGQPRLDPLVLPLAGTPEVAGAARPRPGRPDGPRVVDLDTAALPRHVGGEGVFTIPYGPVRSGVFEAVEYVVETVGEHIPHLRVRPYPKHRGAARRFAGMGVADGVLLAERVEGTASVAHATAFCQAVEAIAATEPPPGAQLVRVLHAELERVANHLDTVVRHTEGSGQAVANARMSMHKERVLRLQARLCGHRFARGVVVAGGVAAPPRLPPAEILAALDALQRDVEDDGRLLMQTPSFLDRLRGTGVVPAPTAVDHGALGPVGRASGAGEDVRVSRPYGAYRRLGFEPAEILLDGDALARQVVRLDEISTSLHLARQAVDELSEHPGGPWRTRVAHADGFGVGWVEAPHGELLYLVATEGGRIQQAKARSASFHNLALFGQAFRGDIFTDFVFIEASFGTSMAGVAG